MSDITSPTAIELLTFRLSDQEYALDIMSVREIRGWNQATPLPHAPSYMKGVINLRGTVLPVMDLAIRLGLPERAQTGRNVIIVVKHDSIMTGFLVDAVSDIIALTSDDLQSPPDPTASGTASVVSALTLFDDRMIRILDLQSTIVTSENVAA